MVKTINEERVTIDSLYQHLRDKHITNLKALECVDDPPDFWLCIGDRKFGIEVTAIVENYGYFARCNRFEQMLKEHLVKSDILSGSYALIFNHKPSMPSINTKEWKALFNRAENFISDTRDRCDVVSARLSKDCYGELRIEKAEGINANHLARFGPSDSKWTGEAIEDLRILIQEAIFKKIKKIENKNIIEDIILAFYAADPFTDERDVRQAFIKISNYTYFHSIYWAACFSERTNILYPEEHGRYGYFLHSKEDTWI